jgi:large subunit ribosomal protein L7/L12
MSKLDKESFIESLKKMNLLEIKELVDALKKEFDINTSTFVNNVNTQDSSKEKKEEQKEFFKVILKDLGSNRISIIKAVREITNLGLAQAKELTDKVPEALIKENINKKDAEDIKTKLEQLGATIELK